MTRALSLRSDALQNRARILDAAAAVFRSASVNAPLDLVIRRAGVARMTFFRHFPDRDSLLAALVERTMDELDKDAQRYSGRPDALFATLSNMVNRITANASFVDYWLAVDRKEPVAAKAVARIHAILGAAVASARAAGLCRADLTTEDIVHFGRMLGGALRGCNPQDRLKVAQRSADLLLQGIRLRKQR